MGAEDTGRRRHSTLSSLDSDALLRRAQSGDTRALNRLFARYVPRLRRWAHGRMPRWARGVVDTEDMVQDAALHTLKHVAAFQSQRDGALLGYLRLTLLNRIRDQFRQAYKRPFAVPFDECDMAATDSPLVTAIHGENRERYVLALKRLRPNDRSAIVARLELGYNYEQLALVLRKPTAEAARLAVRRALLRLAREMQGA